MLTLEWNNRVERWRKSLEGCFYEKLGEAVVSGFVTGEQLPFSEAAKSPYKPMPPGTPWGGEWEYGWFKFTVTTPREAAGKRFVLQYDSFVEALLFVDGKVATARDWAHRELVLARKGVPGRKYQIHAEAYAGHGTVTCGGGPLRPGQRHVAPCPPTQKAVGVTTYGVWEEEVFQLYWDVETLYQARNCLDANSLRVQEIDAGLRDFTTIVDFGLPKEGFLKTVHAARKRLKPLLDCVNGSTSPTLFAFGHGHLDVAWLWPLAETRRKAARTLSNQMALAEEYPGYKFLHSQAQLFDMVKHDYPELYRRVVKAVKKGQIIVDGGMWVEADTNITSGESLIRQFMYGKRFFQEEFGVDSRVLWLPDVFGYTGAMPQIMKGCGIDYFSTAKLFWTYYDHDLFPHNLFTWEGIDGSSVVVSMCNAYTSNMDPKSVLERWNERRQKDGFATRMMPFGHGDGGGGPARDHLEGAKRLKNLEGFPKVKLSSPAEYFKDQEAQGLPGERYVGELYYPCHRGTYTSQARTKKGNRKSEFALREAEMWSAAAVAMARFKFQTGQMDALWQQLLLNQFHDILPGSSIGRVYKEAEEGFARVIEGASKVAADARIKLLAKATAGKSGPEAMTVFNSLSWPRKALVSIGENQSAVYADGDAPLEVQKIGKENFVEVEVPSCGWTSVHLARTTTAVPAQSTSALRATGNSLENDLLRVKFNDKGEITSLFDKEANREMAAGPCNCFKLFHDHPSEFEAWDIDSPYMSTPPLDLPEKARISVLCQGPLLAALRVQRKIGQSVVEQEIRLARGSRRVEFVTRVDWRERQKMLKVAFPVAIHANEAIHEIQFGHLRRPNHFSRPADKDRFEVSSHKWSALAEENRGVAVLNDCKYGLNVLGNCIQLTLLRSPLGPDENADQGVQEFSYAVYPWDGPFIQSNVVRESYELNIPVTMAAGVAREQSLFGVDADTVVIDTVKPAEDKSGDVIVRLYESMHSSTRCTLSTTLPLKSAAQCDMLENVQRELRIATNKLTIELHPFEVKTLRLRLK